MAGIFGPAPSPADPFAWQQWAATQDPGMYGWGQRTAYDPLEGGQYNQLLLDKLPPEQRAAAQAYIDHALNTRGYETDASLTDSGTRRADPGLWEGAVPDMSALQGYSVDQARGPGHFRLNRLIGPDGKPVEGAQQSVYAPGGSLRHGDYAKIASTLAIAGAPALNAYLGAGNAAAGMTGLGYSPTVAGAMSGAATGGILGGTNAGNMQGALKGAAIGGLGGGLAGYMSDPGATGRLGSGGDMTLPASDVPAIDFDPQYASDLQLPEGIGPDWKPFPDAGGTIPDYTQDLWPPIDGGMPQVDAAPSGAFRGMPNVPPAGSPYTFDPQYATGLDLPSLPAGVPGVPGAQLPTGDAAGFPGEGAPSGIPKWDDALKAAGGGGLLGGLGAIGKELAPYMKVALPVLGAIGGSKGGSDTTSTTTSSRTDARFDPYLYGSGGLLDSAKQTFDATKGGNAVQRAGWAKQLAVLNDPSLSADLGSMRATGLGLLGSQVAGNPFLGAGQQSRMDGIMRRMPSPIAPRRI